MDAPALLAFVPRPAIHGAVTTSSRCPHSVCSSLRPGLLVGHKSYTGTLPPSRQPTQRRYSLRFHIKINTCHSGDCSFIARTSDSDTHLPVHLHAHNIGRVRIHVHVRIGPRTESNI